MEKRVFTYVTLALLVWAICVTAVAAYYFTEYNMYHGEYDNLLGYINTFSGEIGNISGMINSTFVRVDILISYGNTTRIWSNNTALPLGSTAFTAIQAVSDVKYENYGGTLGILVTSVNGVSQNATRGWFYWYLNAVNSTWTSPTYSCSQYILNRGDTIAFSYESFNPWPTSPS